MTKESAAGAVKLQVIKQKLLTKVALTPAEEKIVKRLRQVAIGKYQPAQVGKLALRAGEELDGFITALHAAIQRDRILLGNGSFDISLAGIFDDTVIVRDWNSGRFFRSAYTRAENGDFTFGEPQEVFQAFVSAEEVSRAKEQTNSVHVPTGA